MNEKHKRLGTVSSCDIVELDSIGSDILMTTETLVQQTTWGNCGVWVGTFVCVWGI